MGSIAVTHPMEFYPLVYLLMKALPCRTVSRMEGGIVTVCAPAYSNLSVSVGTCKAGIQDQLLKPFPIALFVVSDKRIEPPLHFIFSVFGSKDTSFPPGKQFSIDVRLMYLCRD